VALAAEAPAKNQPQKPAAAAQEPAAEREPPKTRTHFGLGLGVAYFGWRENESARKSDDIGLALELRSGVELSRALQTNFRFGWGLTEFHRTGELIDAANSQARWTNRAFVSVSRWAKKDGKDDHTDGLRKMGAFFAYFGLLFSYAVVGGMYIISPLAPTTFLNFDITLSYHPLDPDFGPYVEGGVGFLSFIHPSLGGYYGGLGPTFGAGYRAGSVQLGAHLTWSPPGVHGEPSSHDSHILQGAFVVTFGH
jgi:hypothetical protein